MILQEEYDALIAEVKRFSEETIKALQSVQRVSSGFESTKINDDQVDGLCDLMNAVYDDYQNQFSDIESAIDDLFDQSMQIVQKGLIT